MSERKEGDWEGRALDWLGRHWKLVTLICWLAFCAWSIFESWNQIRWFGLGDTDDNMRIMQVRALHDPHIVVGIAEPEPADLRSEEHTSELQSQSNLVCRLLLEKKKKKK